MKKIVLMAMVLSLVYVPCAESKRIVEERGGRVKVVKYDDGAWQLLVEEKPYFIKGVVYCPVVVGEDPAEATMRTWMYYDDVKDKNIILEIFARKSF